jgi:hypothetical protein
MRWVVVVALLLLLTSGVQGAGVTVCSTIVTGGLTATTSPPCSPQYGSGGRTVSGTTDAPTAADCNGSVITYNAATPIAVTLPTSGMPGLWCHIAMLQDGAGKITPTISSAAPRNAHSWTGSGGQYSFIAVSTKDGGTTWYLSGDAN